MATIKTPGEKVWKVTIKTSDGTSSEVVLPATPGKVPVTAEIQEIDVVTSDTKADLEKNEDKSKKVNRKSSQGKTQLSKILAHSLLPKPPAACEPT